MSISVPMMADADLLLDKDWFLYLLQGTPIDRDRKITLEHLFDLSWDINVLNAAEDGYNSFATRNAVSGLFGLYVDEINGPNDILKTTGTKVLIDTTGADSFFEASSTNIGARFGVINDGVDDILRISSTKNGGTGSVAIKAATYLPDYDGVAHEVTLVDEDGSSTFEAIYALVHGFDETTYFDTTGPGNVSLHASTFEIGDCDLTTQGISVIDVNPTTNKVVLRAHTLDILEGFTFSGEITFDNYTYFTFPIRMIEAPILGVYGEDTTNFATPTANYGLMSVDTWDLSVHEDLLVDMDTNLKGDIYGQKTDLSWVAFATLDAASGHFDVTTRYLTVNNILTAKEDLHLENDILGFQDNNQSWHTFASLDRASGLFSIEVDNATVYGDADFNGLVTLYDDGDFYGAMNFRSTLTCRNATNDGWNNFATRDATSGYMDVEMRQCEVRSKVRLFNQNTGNSWVDFAVGQSSGVVFTYQGRGYYGTNTNNYLAGANTGDPARIYAPNAVMNYGAGKSDNNQNTTLTPLDVSYSNGYSTAATDCTIYLPLDHVDGAYHTITRRSDAASHYYLDGQSYTIVWKNTNYTSLDLKANNIQSIRVHWNSAAGVWIADGYVPFS